ncbi:DVU0298 family protein [Dehalobacterium formicoaceticum]|uniref:HEAT repeat domain-containing protein n=1 Tax=Dehalobacterium formicoaceticum TaxID=51515 RepID=A0ABT1Y2T8_9FIRM|nr:DVU0298 family protein [Dehalobacterium formicoaceticum]MCR6545188.1 hypothetical protein [Dehalobacterium formicoaceticum]
MTQKERIYQLLAKEAFDQLLVLFDQKPNMIRKYATMAAYHLDEGFRKKSIDFFGYLSEKRAVAQPEYFREIMRRHLWGMNEESGNIDWSAPEIIGAIVAAQPDLFKEFAPIMIEAALCEPVFHQGMLKAVERMAAKDERLIEYHLPRLKELKQRWH